MEKYLVLENIRFVILLFGALTFGGMSWLYFDAISVKRQLNVWASGIGAGILAISFLMSIWGTEVAEYTRYLGYFVLGLGVWFKPMSKRPGGDESSMQQVASITQGESVAGEERGVQNGAGSMEGFTVEEVVTKKKAKTKKSKMGAWWIVSFDIRAWMLPLLPGWVGLGYFRLATIGLERHLSKLGWGMFALMLSEVLNMHVYFQNWSDPRVYLAVSKFGFIWVTQKIVLFVGILTISTWVFSYLLKRFETQLTLFLCTMTIFAFAVATIGFTYTTAGNIRERFIDYQKTTLDLLRYSEERVAQEMILRGRDLGSRQSVLDLFEKGEPEVANKDVGQLQKNGDLSGVWLVNAQGTKVLSLTEGSVVDWSVYTKALKEESAWGYEIEGGVVSLAVAVSVKSTEKTLGTIVLSRKVDSSFLQKMSTKVRSGLWVYKQNKVVSSADQDERVRLLVGQTDNAEELNKIVLANGTDSVRQGVEVLGEVYMGVWGALKNANSTPIGSLAVVSRVEELWKVVEVALKKDYQLAVLSLVLSLVPAVMISRYFVKQLV
ncbi:hypothetical protein A2572_03440 [Candidatus Collierbacteria bacterium RIFOXYD1_FULL_40_9]|uniref:Double Cache domain-containing protein n=1 Tax=Candidatus Collierbacteria bacterium RIFOXYD1_FULL_40_9 TaxID=1817731 RepID=A0A1F5FX19_9BACT|nr:MAG: hypothetical protein A2572_03440 [Candidatus Collierbacteria bacterium RIFOXYD1_FULL_40_9]